jgi:hypothetical protein
MNKETNLQAISKEKSEANKRLAKEFTRDFEKIWEDLHDPDKIKLKKLEQYREEQKNLIKKDLGFENEYN